MSLPATLTVISCTTQLFASPVTLSHTLYLIWYGPGFTPAGTFILPVVGSSSGTSSPGD